VIVREFEPADLERVEALHTASGFAYVLPDFSQPEFFSRRVVSDESGVRMAAFLKLTAEAFLIADARWKTPAWRFEALRQVHTVSWADAKNCGVAEVNAFLPPQIAAKFGKRLSHMGWKRYQGEEWRCYSYDV
jgi:hypothetical protein